jgi:neutral ceramidase
MLVLAAACLALAAQGLSIGKGISDITPDVPLPLGGYTTRGSKRSIPGGDKLHARTVLFDAGRTKIAVVSIDMLTTPESLYREVKKRIPSDITLFLAATHTHSAPDSQMLNDRMTFAIPGIAKFDTKWLQWYADKIAASVTTAIKSRGTRSGILAWEAHPNLSVGRRRFATPDLLATQIFGTNVDVKVGAANFEREHLLLHYAAHGTVYGADELHTRSDWPGAAAEAFNVAVLQGAIGDVLPKEMGSSPQESIEKLVDSLKNVFEVKPLVKHTVTWVWEVGDPINAVSIPVTLDVVRQHPTMAMTYGVPEAFAESIVKQFAPTSATITAFRIGKLAIVGVPGEPTSILGRQIRDAGRRIGFRSVLVCSHVNGWMGYILDPGDYDRGGYEATLSFYGREQGTKVVEAGIAALNKLARLQH